MTHYGRKIMPRFSFPLIALLCVSSSSSAKHIDDSPNGSQRRRLRLGGGYDNDHAESEQTYRENESAFYDLSMMTDDEKLGLAKMAYSLTRYGDAVNWNELHDNFVHAILQDNSDSIRQQQTRNSRSQNSKRSVNHVNYDDAGDLHDMVTGATDDAYDGMIDDTLGGEIIVTSANNGLMKENYIIGDGNDKDDEAIHGNEQATDMLDSDMIGRHTSRRLSAIDGDVFDGYKYSKGACPNAGSLGVPCAPDNISALCNKYDRTEGSFSDCIDACRPAFCCIHDAPRDLNLYAPNCNTDENCSQYNYCYIAWWKLHDTVGPALFLRVEQDDEFYDIDAEEIEGNNAGDSLFTQVLLHHFDDINKVIEDGTKDNEFNADNIFLDEDYWVYPVANKVDVADP